MLTLAVYQKLLDHLICCLTLKYFNYPFSVADQSGRCDMLCIRLFFMALYTQVRFEPQAAAARTRSISWATGAPWSSEMLAVCLILVFIRLATWNTTIRPLSLQSNGNGCHVNTVYKTKNWIDCLLMCTDGPPRSWRCITLSSRTEWRQLWGPQE